MTGEVPATAASSTSGIAARVVARAVAAIRRDFLLSVLATVLTIVVVAPLFATPFIPLHDLPGHLGTSAIIGRILSGHGVSFEHFDVRFVPVPYWTSYLWQWVGSVVFGPLVAAKLLVAAALLLPPFGAMRLLRALGRSPRMGLLAFLASWEHSLYYGFVAYGVGVGLCLFALATLVESTTTKEVVRRCWPWGFVLALTHAHATGIFLVAAAALALGRRPLRTGLRLHAIGAAGPLLAMAPWIIATLLGAKEESAKHAGPRIDLVDVGTKAARFYEYSLDNVPNAFGRTSTGLAFFLLLTAPALYALARARARNDDDAGVRPLAAERISDAGTIAMYAAALALYVAAPMGIMWPIEQWYIYPRQATFLLLAGLFVPRPSLAGPRALLLVPPVVIVLMCGVAVFQQLSQFGERARPFLRIIDAMPEEQRFLALTLDDGDPVVKLSPYNQFHAYVLAAKGGYDPNTFDTPSLPVHPDARAKLPAPPWNQMGAFTMEKHGLAYDYIIVQGLGRDPLVNEQRVERVVEAGRWRLYKVRR